MGGNFIQWMTGYDRYRNAMSNRTIRSEGFGYVSNPDGSGLTELKQFLFDHGAEDTAIGGGLAVFTMNFFNIEYGVYPAGSPEEGKPFIKDTYGNIDHAMTIVGYNDLVEFDYDGINGCTNHLDTNGDGQVTMADWEKGALIIANSHGKTWPDTYLYPNRDPGFCYLPYRLLTKIKEITRLVVDPEVEPEMAYKVTVDHSNRKLLRCEYFGVSDNINAIYPNVGSRIISFQAGEDEDISVDLDILPMQGYNSDPLEFGYDLTENIGYLAGADPIKYFLAFREVNDTIDGNNLFVGVINSFTLIDYRNSNELHIKYPYENIRIGQQKELTMLYDVLPAYIASNTIISDNFNMGIPATSTIAPYTTLGIMSGVNFYFHNTDLVVSSDSELNLDYRTTFYGFDEQSVNRIINSGDINMNSFMSIMVLNNCDLHLLNGSSSTIERIYFGYRDNTQNSELLIEDGANVVFKDNSRIGFYGEGKITGKLTTNNLSNLQIMSNSILSLSSLSEIKIVAGTILNIGKNAKLIIENGSHLVIEPGVVVELSEGAEIVVGTKAYFTATGTSFTYTGTTGNWMGINAISGSSIELNNVKIYNAVTGVKGTGNYQFDITNSTFEGCLNGIDVSGMSTGSKYSISGNRLTGIEDGRGITITQSDGVFSNNSISYFGNGVCLILCSPEVVKNEISYNKYFGMTISGQNAMPELVNYNNTNQISKLNNVIEKNGYENNSSLFPSGNIGILPYANVYMRYNDVISSPRFYGISVAQLSPMGNKILIDARSNYWGAAEVTDDYFFGHVDYTIDYTPYFSSSCSDPLANDELTAQAALLMSAVELELKGNYTAANKLYEVLIKRYENTPEYYVSMNRLPNLYAKAGWDNSGLLKIYDKAYESEGTTHKKFFKGAKVTANIKGKRYDDAIAIAEEMKVEADFDEEIILADINIAIANMLKDLENNSKSRTNTDHSAILSSLLSKLNENEGKVNTPSDITESVLPERTELFQNYPNPFNPVTQIRFALAKTADVKLSVYNISGQKIAELANGSRQAGVHAVYFDGSRFNSGVYYYTLEVEGKFLTQKMILIK